MDSESGSGERFGGTDTRDDGEFGGFGIRRDDAIEGAEDGRIGGKVGERATIGDTSDSALERGSGCEGEA